MTNNAQNLTGARTPRPNPTDINARRPALSTPAVGKFSDLINKIYKMASKAKKYGQSRGYAQVGEVYRG